jgi:photosystem II protein PsbQ
MLLISLDNVMRIHRLFSIRSLFALALALVVSLGLAVDTSLAARAKKTTYTAADIEQIQKFEAPLDAARARMGELEDLVAKRNWVFVRNFIHGPLGDIRRQMMNVEQALLPKDRPAAREAAKDLFGHLVAIDDAAGAKDTRRAEEQFREALKDFDAFLKLVPQASAS